MQIGIEIIIFTHTTNNKPLYKHTIILKKEKGLPRTLQMGAQQGSHCALPGQMRSL